jgi:peptide/nickel transport system ATP-binding protein
VSPNRSGGGQLEMSSCAPPERAGTMPGRRAPLRQAEALLVAEDVVVEHGGGQGGGVVHAVSGVSLDLLAGETLGIVGESGCGKSSLGRALLQLPPPTSGTVRLEGVELTGLDRRALRKVRARLQMIFQDPLSSLNPRRRAHELVAEPIAIANRRVRAGDHDRVRATFEAVGLDPDQVWDRHPAELSGGQCQRLCIARALVAAPAVLVCDEPVSALDVSVQAQILNLLEDVKTVNGLSLLFVAHDLAVVRNISDRVMVMYLGRTCEVAPAEDLFAGPLHPYTEVLLASIPDPDPDRAPVDGSLRVRGEPPSPVDPPSGCRFRTRCPRADERCAAEVPELVERRPGHWVACHHPNDQAVAIPTRSPTRSR